MKVIITTSLRMDDNLVAKAKQLAEDFGYRILEKKQAVRFVVIKGSRKGACALSK